MYEALILSREVSTYLWPGIRLRMIILKIRRKFMVRFHVYSGQHMVLRATTRKDAAYVRTCIFNTVANVRETLLYF